MWFVVFVRQYRRYVFRAHGAFDDEHSHNAQRLVDAKFVDEFVEQHETTMTRDVIASVDEHANYVDHQLVQCRTARRPASLTLSLQQQSNIAV